MKTTPVLVAGLLVATALVLWLARGPEEPTDPEPARDATGDQRPSAKRDSWPTPESRGSGQRGQSFPTERGTRGGGGPAVPSPQVPPIPAELAGQLKALETAGPEAEDRAERMLAIAREWAGRDPQGALAWASTLPLGEDRAVAGEILRSWADEDPTAALKALDALKASSPEWYRDGERRLFNYWAGNDPAAAWEAAGAVMDPQWRSEIQSDILLHWSQSEPEVVAGILGGMLATPGAADDLSAAFEATAVTLGEENPSAAASWATSLPEGAARSSAVSGLVGGWMRQDFPAASNWLGSLEPGEARDAGISKLVAATRNRDPQTAVEWASRASDPTLRSRLVTTATLSWWSADPEAAQRALNDSRVLSEEEKASIREAFAAMEE